MSYKIPIGANRRQSERQQEKLRIARQALARVEAKYARKQRVKQSMESPAKVGAVIVATRAAREAFAYDP